MVNTEGLALWIPGMDSIFQEESLLILTAMIISFSLGCGMKMCAGNETVFPDPQSTR